MELCCLPLGEKMFNRRNGDGMGLWCNYFTPLSVFSLTGLLNEVLSGSVLFSVCIKYKYMPFLVLFAH